MVFYLIIFILVFFLFILTYSDIISIIFIVCFLHRRRFKRNEILLSAMSANFCETSIQIFEVLLSYYPLKSFNESKLLGLETLLLAQEHYPSVLKQHNHKLKSLYTENLGIKEGISNTQPQFLFIPIVYHRQPGRT